MREIPKPFERYRHFKGKEYQILALAKSADDLSDVVVYQGLYEPYRIYVRSLQEFLSPVDGDKYPGLQQEERFARITEESSGTGSAFGSAGRNVQQIQAAPSKAGPSDNKLPSGAAKQEVQAQKHETPGERALKQKPGIDPVLLRFLDAETDDEKLTVLSEVRDLLTPALLTPMELSLGMEPQETVDPDIRFKQIRNTLQYKQKYEKSRRG